MTSLLRNLWKVSIPALSYIFRWTSLRGTIPQPVVAFLVGMAAIAAPRNRKLMTIGITILGLRILAETLFDYVYDDDYTSYEDDLMMYDSRGSKPVDNEE